mmetsp:Transcript_23448/g.34581  ORF Transcript_23448/g.34581 Transcript_23448/m.34581 type:complete len:92 (+) Transcript_23448:145-420(+)
MTLALGADTNKISFRALLQTLDLVYAVINVRTYETSSKDGNGGPSGRNLEVSSSHASDTSHHLSRSKLNNFPALFCSVPEFSTGARVESML